MPSIFFPAAWKRRLESWAHVAGLLATAWLVLPHGGRDLFRRILMGWTVASLALTWALIMVLILRLVVRNVGRVDVVPATLRAAGAGVWFAPAVLLAPTPAGLTAAVVLVIGATRLLCADCPGEAALPVRDGLALPDDWERGAGPAQGVSIATAAGLQGAVAMLLLGHSNAAGVLLCLAVAALTSVAIARGAWSESRGPNLPRSVLGLCLTFLLATMAGRFLGGGNGWGFGEGSGSSSSISAKSETPVTKIGPDAPHKPESPPTPPPGATGEVTPDTHLAEANAPGSFPGVILWPDVKPEITLVTPYPVVRSAGGPSLLRPFVIPFGGEYWMYRWPFARPPRTSYFRRGTPAKLAFATTDRSALEMEALQKLDRSISLNCCSRIEIAVQNADPAASGIALELVVIDNDPPYKQPLSLGKAPLHSAPGGAPLVAETLEFAIPPNPRLAKFDEIKIVFHRDSKHQDRSARVAIDRFILVP